MKRSWINRGSKGLKRSRLKSRGKKGSLFPHRRHPKFMAWMLAKAEAGQACDGCGRWRSLDRAHLVAEGSGGDDLGNVVLLDRECHTASEKRVDAWIAETGVDLYEIARNYEHEYEDSLR